MGPVRLNPIQWGKKCRRYKGSKLGIFWAITPERLGVQRADFACA